MGEDAQVAIEEENVLWAWRDASGGTEEAYEERYGLNRFKVHGDRYTCLPLMRYVCSIDPSDGKHDDEDRGFIERLEEFAARPDVPDWRVYGHGYGPEDVTHVALACSSLSGGGTWQFVATAVAPQELSALEARRHNISVLEKWLAK